MVHGLPRLGLHEAPFLNVGRASQTPTDPSPRAPEAEERGACHRSSLEPRHRRAQSHRRIGFQPRIRAFGGRENLNRLRSRQAIEPDSSMVRPPALGILRLIVRVELRELSLHDAADRKDSYSPISRGLDPALPPTSQTGSWSVLVGESARVRIPPIAPLPGSFGIGVRRTARKTPHWSGRFVAAGGRTPRAPGASAVRPGTRCRRCSSQGASEATALG